ncbi:Low-temperature-induced 65 kDa protein [Morella rubra]|uniref:Low-temperature-induced 65 kDa protein n=1 Tax=Morella rubra TaxID=262757 RepID=A0A6A1VD61_9ROSI|nr:Low-temperature-induced 65 kDa protein [Morella rubra]
MDSLVARPHGQNYEHEPHNGGLHRPVEEGEDEQSHEKKSALKKVKAKAKKIKDTLTRHGHGHNHVQEDHHDDRPIPDDHDLDLDQEDHDEDEEMVEDPEVHGGTAFEFAAVRSAIPGQVEELVPPGDFGNLATMTEDPVSPDQDIHETQVIEPMNSTPVSQSHAVNGTDPSKTFVPGEEASMGQPRVNLERPITGLEEDPNSPNRGRPEAYTPSNYQTKVTDPTRAGDEEAGVTPILQAFDKVEVYDETESKPAGPAIGNQFTSAGSHDQFSPEPIPQEAQAIRDKPQLPEGFSYRM